MIRKTWAEVDLDIVEENYLTIKKQAGGRPMMPVIKADAYGHGAVALARVYEGLGAEYFAVSSLDEAIQLRKNGISTPILILGYTPPQRADELVENGITQAVYDIGQARALSDGAAKAGGRLKVHIKTDTGMTRIGVYCREDCMDAAADAAEAIAALPHLEAEGIFTHFARADEPGYRDYTDLQYARFTGLLDMLEKRGVKFRLRHCANSGAILWHGDKLLDIVRPGIILYGQRPSDCDMPIDLPPALELKTLVANVKTVDGGEPISYGGRYVTEGKSVIATVPVGYADGLSRALSGKITMLVNGRPAPQVGNICMDQCMIDVTGCGEVRIGDEVTVYGGRKAGAMSACDIAAVWGTINYEVLCQIAKRVPRVYIRDSKPVSSMNYLV